MQEMDQRDRELLGALQGDVPLASTPFAIIGQTIEMSEKEVIKRTDRLRREGVVRHFGAQFDSRALGYRTCLVAARVNDDHVDEAASVINAHPGVTRNIRRNHDFNLWFTIAVRPSTKLGFDRTLEILAEEAGCEAMRPLPTLKLFKASGGDNSELHGDSAAPQPLTPAEIECVRILQYEFPLQPRPFDALARNAGLAADDLLLNARALLQRGVIRRFSAVVQSRKPGFSASAMGVWKVPENETDHYGAQLAQHRGVSQCYLRPVYDDWPYNIYTTVHGRSVDECESIINDLAIDTGLTQKRALYPTREYKKSRLTYFSPDESAWEEARAGRRAAAAS